MTTINLSNTDAFTMISTLTTIKFIKVAADKWKWYNTIAGQVIFGDTGDVEVKIEELLGEGFEINN